MDRKSELKRINDALNSISKGPGIEDFAISSKHDETKIGYHLAADGARVFIRIKTEIKFVIDEKKPLPGPEEVADEEAEEPKPKKKKLKA